MPQSYNIFLKYANKIVFFYKKKQQIGAPKRTYLLNQEI